MSFNGDGVSLLSGGKLIFKCYLYGYRDLTRKYNAWILQV